MYKLIGNSKMPSFLKVLLYILLTISCVYWIGWLIYQILEVTRKAINGITCEKGRWWFFLLCVVMIIVAICIAMQYNPFLNIINYFKLWLDNLRLSIINLLQ